MEITTHQKRALKFLSAAGLIIVVFIAITLWNNDNSISGGASIDTIRGHSPEMMMDDRSMMKSASIAADSASFSSMSAGTTSQDRKIEEAHSFRFRVERDLVADQYERAFSACSLPSCEVVNGNLNVNGVTKNASLTIRIEPEEFDTYIAYVGNEDAGVSLVNHSRSATDRTRQYQDVDARLNSQIHLRDRLITMVNQYDGQNIRSLLEIERELARVQGGIESMQSQLRDISSRTSRITTSISFFSDQLTETPDHPPYLKNAFKEIAVIFEKNLSIIIRLSATLAPYLIGLFAIFLAWKSATFWRKNK